MEMINSVSTTLNALGDSWRMFSTGPRRLKRAVRIPESHPTDYSATDRPNKAGGSASFGDDGADRYDRLVDEYSENQKKKLADDVKRLFAIPGVVEFEHGAKPDPSPRNAGLRLAIVFREGLNSRKDFALLRDYFERRPIKRVAINCLMAHSNYDCGHIDRSDPIFPKICFHKILLPEDMTEERIVVILSRDIFETGLNPEQQEHYRRNYVGGGLPIMPFIRDCLYLLLGAGAMNEDEDGMRLDWVNDRLRDMRVV